MDRLLPKATTHLDHSSQCEFRRVWLCSGHHPFPIPLLEIPLPAGSTDTAALRTRFLLGSLKLHGLPPAQKLKLLSVLRPPKLPPQARHTEQVSAAPRTSAISSCTAAHAQLAQSRPSAPLPLQGEWTRMRNKPC